MSPIPQTVSKNIARKCPSRGCVEILRSKLVVFSHIFSILVTFSVLQLHSDFVMIL